MYVRINGKLDQIIQENAKGNNILFHNTDFKSILKNKIDPTKISKEENIEYANIVEKFYSSKTFNLLEKQSFFNKLTDKQKAVVLEVYFEFMHLKAPQKWLQ